MKYVVIASGPSLTVGQCEAVRAWRISGTGKVVVVNRTFYMAPWADYLYSGDYTYLKHDIKEIKCIFEGEVWTRDEQAVKEFNFNHIPMSVSLPTNSGQQAVNFVRYKGADVIVLLGFDMGKVNGRTHWHEPYEVNVEAPYQQWVNSFNEFAKELVTEGVTVLNATPDSALECFPKVGLYEALKGTI